MKTLFIALLVFFANIGAPAAAPSASDGQQDFNWELGAWETKLRRLKQPLSGSQEWLEYTGTTTVTPLMDKRANIVEFDVQGPAGRIAGVSLRLYQPGTGQWTLHFANLANGAMTEPMQGSFKQGLGTFFGLDEVNGRKVLVRFLIIPVNANQWRFEQAYSVDNGKTWEDNWIAVDTRQPVLPSRAR